MSLLFLVLGILLLGNVDSSQNLVKLGLEACQVERFCDGNVSAKINSTGCCNPCLCDRSCIVTRNCCPDADIPITSLPEPHYSLYSSCENIDVKEKSEPLYLQTPYVTMVSMCPNGSPCKPEGTKLSKTELSSYVIVSDTRTGVIFINKRCALCHGVKDYVEWTVDILNSVPPSFLETILSGEASRTYLFENFRMIMVPPLKYQAATERFLCRRQTLRDKCNDSMEWENYNKHLEIACTSNFFEIMKAKGLQGTYRNPFCFQCNEQKSALVKLCKYSIFGSKSVFSQYSRMLRLLNDDPIGNTAGDTACKASDVLDTTQNVCRQLNCPPLTRLNHGKCEPMPLVLHQYRYFVFVKFTYTHVTQSNRYSNVSSPGTKLAESLIQRTLQLAQILPRCLLFAHVMQYAATRTTESGFYVATEVATTASDCFFPSIFKRLEKLYQTGIITEIKDVHFNINVVNIPFLLNDSLLFKDTNHFYDIRSRIETVEHVGIGDIIVSKRRFNYVSYVIYPLFRKHIPCSCPFFILNQSELCNISFDGACNIPRAWLKNNFFAIPEFTENGLIITRYRICVDKFYDLLQHSKSTPEAIEGILSLTLSILSLICIVPTVIVMLRNRKIDPSARVLFLSSVGNLFVAQVVFQFGSGWINSPVICKLSGIAMHFAWLGTVFSFNSFCLLVFRQARCTNTDFNVRRSVTALLIYTFVTPTLFVAINIAYSLVGSGGSDIGYGNIGVQCNLNSPLMRGLLFALPIFLVMICNVCVFIAIVHTIRSITSKTHYPYQTGYHNAAMYFRLLMFTGLAWLIGFINEFVHSEVLGIVFSITIGGQGIGFGLAFALRFKRDESDKHSGGRTDSSDSKVPVNEEEMKTAETRA